MKRKFVLMVSLLLATSSFALEATDKPTAAAKVVCNNSNNVVSISVEFKVGEKDKIKIPIRNDAPKFFKAGKLSGCPAVLKNSKLKVTDLPPSALKDLNGVKVVNIQLPAFDGMEFELGFDALILKRSNDSWVQGPIISAGGMENSVENVFESISENELTVSQTSSGEGQTSTTALKFKKEKEGWRQLH